MIGSFRLEIADASTELVCLLFVYTCNSSQRPGINVISLYHLKGAGRVDFNAVPWEDLTLKTHVRHGVRQLWWTALSALLLYYYTTTTTYRKY